MPSHLLKSSPMDTTPPVALPPNIVELEIDGVNMHIDVHQELSCLDKEDEPELEVDESAPEPSTSRLDLQVSLTVDVEQSTLGKSRKSNKLLRKSIRKSEGKGGDSTKSISGRKFKQETQDVRKLPEAVFRILEDYKLEDAPARPNNAYIRYIERTAEELADMVEYDMDELDFCWLEDQNVIRRKENLPEVQPEVMELIMDRLEKESYFQMQSSGMEQGPIIDDDAVCCICMDGECQNANAILFCDMCNLAVHQECYGVPYIPEGQWLCRRCLLSPSIAVDCILCPNKGGAFKETECKRWAHVVCAIWIPEVCFANAVFLEPVDNIKSIPPARWRLCCFICKQKGVGACIQCYKSNCYTAFHVTCALQAGLCMRMETVRLASAPGVTVKKTAFCDTHAPPDFIAERDSGSETARQKLKQIRKMLAEKRCAPPVVSVPTIPPEQIANISSSVTFTKKNVFMKRLMAYWKLKRMERNGVPLLRRLQVASSVGSKSSRKYDSSQSEVNLQNYGEIMRIRQDLEKGRLLCELTRKREKIKREVINSKLQVWDMRIQPFNYFLSSIVDELCQKDTQSIFTQPVDPEHVHDYLSVVKNPIDLSTMQTKIFDFAYSTIEDLEMDFQLMINNCMLYNSRDTVFYRAATKMQELGGIVFREAKRCQDRIGYKGGIHTRIAPSLYTALPPPIDEGQLASDIENVLDDKSRYELPFDEHVRLLEQTIDKCLLISHPVSRKKKFVRAKNEILKLKRKNRREEEGCASGTGGDASSLDEDDVAPSPFDLGDTVLSSDAGEEGPISGARGPKPIFSSIRRRLRSTENEALPTQFVKVSTPSPRALRRMSRSSEAATSQPSHFSVSAQPPAITRLPVMSSKLGSQLSSSLASRKRGRPPKILKQRGRGSKVRISSRTSAPLRERSLSTVARRGALRGGRGRVTKSLRRPLRRSVRVVELQQMQAQTSNNPEKEDDQHKESGTSRQVTPSRTSPQKTMPGRVTGSRNSSPTLNSQKSLESSSRNASPVLGLTNKSQRAHSNRQVSPILGSPLKVNQIRGVQRKQTSPTTSLVLGGKGRSGSSRHTSPAHTSPGRSQPARTARPSSPLVALPLKPHHVRALEKRQNNANLVAPPKSRVTRERTVKITNNASNLLRQGPISPKSMEDAAKSIVCEDRLLRKQVSANNVKTGKLRKVEVFQAGAPNTPSRGGASRGSRRNSSGKYVTGENLTCSVSSSSNQRSPDGRKIKGPAGAVGRRKKSAEVNGPISEAACIEVEQSRVLFPVTNGLIQMKSTSPAAANRLVSSLTAAKKRPRRGAAIAASSQGANSHSVMNNNNSMLSGANISPTQLRKTDSFSVYRSGGDNEINSYSEGESGNEDDDEVEEEEEEEDDDDDDDDDEEGEEEEEEEEEESIGKAVTASDDEEEDEDDDDDDDDEDDDDDDDDEEEEETELKAKAEEREEEDEDEDDSDDDSSEDGAEEEDSSDSNDSSSDTDSSSTSSSSLSSSTSAASSISKASSSSSMTTPKHFHHVKVMKHRKMRRRSNSSTLGQLQRQTTILSSPFPRPVPPQLASPNTVNNNNIHCSNKEKDKDDIRIQHMTSNLSDDDNSSNDDGDIAENESSAVLH